MTTYQVLAKTRLSDNKYVRKQDWNLFHTRDRDTSTRSYLNCVKNHKSKHKLIYQRTVIKTRTVMLFATRGQKTFYLNLMYEKKANT